MMEIEACLLDYGNTIVEFGDRQISFVLERFVKVLEERFRPVDMDALRMATEKVYSISFQGKKPTYREITPQELMDRLLRELGGDDGPADSSTVEECDRRFQEIFVESIPPDPRIQAFVESLSRRLPVGLVSNYPCGSSLRQSLHRVGIDRFLDPIVVSGEVGYVKPHRRIFDVALEGIGVPAERILFVGDRWDADMIGARDAGMRTCHVIGYAGGVVPADEYRQYRPEFTIDRLEEVNSILNGSGRET